MNADHETTMIDASDIQKRFGRMLYWGNWVGVLCLLASFLIYMCGWMTPFVPVDSLLYYSTMSLSEYMDSTHESTGWSWVGYLDHGDYLNYIGLAVLCGNALVGFMVIVAPIVRRRAWVYVVLVLAQIAVFFAALSGLVGGPAH